MAAKKSRPWEPRWQKTEQLGRGGQGITHLVVVPDDILGFLPFETLMDGEGKYLVEIYDITYLQSLALSQMLSQRLYADSRRPLLAFGGAIYERDASEDAASTEPVPAEGSFGRFIEQALTRNEGSYREVYSRLGISEWANIPGSFDEVKAIGELVEDSVVRTGGDVSEATVKRFSENGILRDYKILHFSTHGLALAEYPELSALVLSQDKASTDREDGYLTMKEILDLDLASDFVNLSACETGLGKIYGGEGVVGLTQSFLIAGANGLLVSLWQVADVSTKEFMILLYELVEGGGMSYAEAAAEVKRSFLERAEYRNPFFWAPFVYYGR